MIVRMLLCGVLLTAASPVPAVTRPNAELDTSAADLARCQRLAPQLREDCVEQLMQPSPEALARMELGRRTQSAYYSRIAERIAASGQPRELAFAATLRMIASLSGLAPDAPQAPDAQVRAWRRQALARGADDVLALTLLLQGDERMRELAAARWRALEPDNFAAWLAGNPTAEVLLPAAARSSRYDNYFYPRVRWMVNALRAHPPTASEAQAFLAASDPVPAAFDSEEFAVIAAISIDVVAIPALLPLMQACRGEAQAATFSRRSECRRAAELMADRSDSLLSENVGIGMLGQLASSDAERTEALQRRRRFDWQMQQRIRVDSGAQRPEQNFLRLFRDPSLVNERELTERMLREAGVPLDPPDGWQSPRRD